MRVKEGRCGLIDRIRMPGPVVARVCGTPFSSTGLRALASKELMRVYEALAVEGAKGNERASRVWKGDGYDLSRKSLEFSSRI